MSNSIQEIKVGNAVETELCCDSTEENEYELYMVLVHTPQHSYYFNKEDIIYCGENEIIAKTGPSERWHIRNATIIEKHREVTKEP